MVWTTRGRPNGSPIIRIHRCFGFCEQGPIVKMIPDNTFYVSVKPEDAEEIVREHVVKTCGAERLLYTAPDTGTYPTAST